MFINDVALTLRSCRGGVPIGGGTDCDLTVLLYADDIVLLSENVDDMQLLMTTVHDYSHRWRFQVNPTKCGLMKFNSNGSSQQPTRRLTIGGVEVKWVTTYKYLGIELHNGVPFRQYRKRALASATSAGYRVAAMGMYSGKLPVTIGVQAYKSLVRPLLEFGGEVVSAVSDWKEAEHLQVTMAKRILQCPTRTSSVACRGELGLVSLESRYQQLRLCFYGKIIKSGRGTPLREVFEASMSLSASSDGGDERVPDVAPEDGWTIYRPSSISNRGLILWCEQIKCDLAQVGMSDYWRRPEMMDDITIQQWGAKVRTAIKTKEAQRWWKEVNDRPILRTYITIREPLKLSLQSYLTVPHGGWNDRKLLGRKALTRLRCGSNDLRIDTGRWEGLPADERLCIVCGEGDVENEQHFLLVCTNYQEERTALWESVERLVNGAARIDADGAIVTPFIVADLTRHQQLTLIMTGSHQRIVGDELQQRVMSAILIAIGEWHQKRERWMSVYNNTIDA